ncbi:uncharacterized protein FPRO_16150 [Fusarium proliferatum ET1]|uniref:Azaphilone pigments biosynthesis cluster protein L N-terminal domain-containing protein n=1 Tax=Fusarium proliferatum (strain ET1) TaxID=1227346 RepID=A0A1L7WBE6_FUSPR|nr:uncharacterized protein FPRO_16150 [Fusarium proliferatum ET1]CZR49946.1 uncharacterized protein FPRO_16150 [Fusarium proliferatum ET1]
MAEVIGLISGLLTLTTVAHQSVTKYSKNSRAPGGDVEVDLSALKVTLEQCTRSCEEFERELRAYSSRSSQDRASFRDWAKLTYRGGDGIEDFRQQLIGYKSTIVVVLGFANLRTSTITVEAIRSCRGLIETTTIDLEAHLAEVKQKLDTLACRTIASPEPDEATIRYIENERLGTEKGLQLCLELSRHIDQIQLQFGVGEEDTPNLLGPRPTSRMVVSEGLGGSKDYIGFALERLMRHRQKVSERVGACSPAAASPDDKLLFDNLNDEAEAVRHSLNLCSNTDTYLEEKISNIENHAEGDDTIQFMVSKDGKPLNGKKHGIGSRLKQAGGHFKEESLQQISQDFTTISLHQTGGNKPSKSTSPPANSETTLEPLGTPFNGRGFTLTPKPTVSSTPSTRSTTA